MSKLVDLRITIATILVASFIAYGVSLYSELSFLAIFIIVFVAILANGLLIMLTESDEIPIERKLSVPGWTCHIEEISAGVYQVQCSNKEGMSVSKQGTDINETLDELSVEASKMVNE